MGLIFGNYRNGGGGRHGRDSGTPETNDRIEGRMTMEENEKRTSIETREDDKKGA